MPRLIDLRGKKFGYWEVLDKPHKLIKRHTHWKCRCVCGKEKYVKQDSLVGGRSKSCGCKKTQLRMETNNYDSLKSTQKRCFNVYKRNAKKRERKFNLTLEDFINISQKPCYYCGENPSNFYKRKYNGGKDFIYNGIDRLNNDKGYTLENSVPCCYKCNLAKHTMSEKEFLNWIKKVYKHSVSATEIRKKDKVKELWK